MNKIVIASVLKPVNDPRAFDKLGLSLRETNKYHLNIIGFFAKNAINLKNVVFTTIYNAYRLHPKRLLVTQNFARALKEYRPELVVVTTYELLPAAIWGKKRYKYKLIYDVQENYSFNIRDHRTLPFGLRHLMVKLVQIIEKKAAPYIDHFLLAEESYQYELPFLHKYTVLQNKYQGIITPVKPFRLDQKKRFEFIISGTITSAYGIAEAMNWFGWISLKYPGSQLLIIGHITLNSYRKKLENIAKKIEGITLRLSAFPIPSPEITHALEKADIVLLPYLQKASIKYKIPTKLFESLAMGKPILHSENKNWTDLVLRYPGGKAINFTDANTAITDFGIFLSMTFYQSPPSSDLTWSHDESRWVSLVDKLLH
ncbi:MAG TPA: hypothetical protein VK921_07235 [Anditalea sp.]|nr:hypothetical protein [Anditalea sp.]